MPCTKCEEGKYKWGETGECKYDSLDACEKANHKYNKMQPTPLGKKSYAEYEKELKEFNLSKVEKVDLGLMDDLEKLLNEAEKRTKNNKGGVKYANGVETELINVKKKIKDTVSLSEKSVKENEQLINKIMDASVKVEKSAKELGINPAEIPAMKKMQKTYTAFDQSNLDLEYISDLLKKEL